MRSPSRERALLLFAAQNANTAPARCLRSECSNRSLSV
ncbi:hypothetical protein A2U01_0083050 [Trifolium medium]|uniref:Uncharacterized protein n=1 Tax=Trifolium medium TaxID=97028 RepID=A0A392TKX5_9FABA|nr:hypothetical protein [Trifolium medium]